MKKLFTCITLLACMCNNGIVFAQGRMKKSAAAMQQQSAPAKPGSVWAEVPVSQGPPAHLHRQKLTKYALYTLNIAALKSQFWALSASYINASVITVPMPDGTTRDFKVWETPMMDEAMAALYPDIKTFTGEAVDDRRVTAKFDFTLFGFHAVVFDGERVALIDPFDNYNDGYYVLHYKSDEDRPYSQRMVCEVHGDNELSPAGEPMQLKQAPSLPGTDLFDLKIPAALNDKSTKPTVTLPTGPTMAALTTNGTTIRTYRLALSANHFYCQAATGLPSPTIAQCFSSMTTSMNRVNGVYNREISVQLNFCANENLLIWPTATGSTNGADPFAAINFDGSTCIATNQTTCDARIGTANYDVGHVFTTGAGGLAGLGVICSGSSKARGVTGSGFPVGDSYDIDYVCHELGHQFGSSHTFNNNQDGSCNLNASSTHAYEPASGATIMDYAGICSPDNVQSNSNPYFSFNSLEQIQAHMSGSGGTCAVTAPSGHAAATLSAFTAIYNIPYKTPFELTSPTATVGGGDTAVTYGWCQRNLGDFGRRLNQTFVFGPIFRSYQPVYTETRIFPRLSNVLSGVLSNSGEKAPDTTRFLTFKPVVRNIMGGMGCFTIPDDTIHINAFSTGGANSFAGFRVTSQAAAVTYLGGSTQTITWNVVGTNAAPVNATNVDIFMSTDGGNTWPYALGTYPNTGTANVPLGNPTVTSTQTRIKVKGSGNVFFNINGSNFTVNPGPTTDPITGTFTVCVGATTDLDDATAGGTWSSSNTAVGTVNVATGVVGGIATGTTTITYHHPGTGNVTAVVTVLAIPVPAAITGTTTLCAGTTTTLSNASAGGVWSSTNAAVGTVSTAGIVAGISGGTTTISYTITNGCGTGASTVNVTVNAPVAVAPITGTATVCTGLTTSLGNVTPGGVWSSSNTAVGTVNTSGLVSGLVAGTTTISYTVTGGGCTSASSVIVTVNTTPVATTTPTGAHIICIGGNLVITGSPATAGFTYQWQNTGVDIAGATDATYTATAAGDYHITVTSNAGCASSSADVNVTVSGTGVVVPSVSVAAAPGTTICSAVGTVTFTATPVNEGSTPTYQWYVNAIAVGPSAPTYAYIPANGDIVSCELTSSLPCATPATVSDAVTMTVNTSVVPAVTVNPVPNDTICTGGTVTYAAMSANGGPTPTYTWNVNGINVSTGPTYTTTPANGDVVVCQMTASAPCSSAPIVNSAAVVMTVQAPATNTISISASSPTIHPGESVTFAAIAPFAGPSAVYEWFINTVPVPGATTATFTTSGLTNGQVVYCKVTTNEPCVTPHIALSAGFTISVTTGLWEVTGDGSSFSVSPNPNRGAFTVSGKLAVASGEVSVTVTNMLGQTIYSTTAKAQNGGINELVSMPASVPTGTYLVTVTSGQEHAVFRVVIDK